MNLIKCRPSQPDVWVTCSVCEGRLLHSQAWADLDGRPFEAYFHEACKPTAADAALANQGE